MGTNAATIEYCNFGAGYIRLSLPSEGKSSVRTLTIELDDYILEDGIPKNIEAIADKIKSKVKNKAIPPITLLLRCEGTYKSIVTLPPMNFIKANALFAKEQKTARANAGYVIATNVFQHALGYIYSIYFMPKSVIDGFKKLAKLLDTKIQAVEPFGLSYNTDLNPGDTYVNLYLYKKVCTMTLVVNKSLVSTYDFEYENERDIVSRFLLVISKHEFEIAHKQIQHLYVESDEEINIDLGVADTVFYRHGHRPNASSKK